MTEETTKLIRPRCPKCKSTQVYYRLKTNDYVCVTCGGQSKAEEVKTYMGTEDNKKDKVG
jgi:transcription initiation factor TFIIIB Brf1 subunit/transcription initiation factor TFIIB